MSVTLEHGYRPVLELELLHSDARGRATDLRLAGDTWEVTADELASWVQQRATVSYIEAYLSLEAVAFEIYNAEPALPMRLPGLGTFVSLDNFTGIDAVTLWNFSNLSASLSVRLSAPLSPVSSDEQGLVDARASPRAPEKYRPYTLYFGTDRKFQPEASRPDLAFGIRRGGEITYGNCIVSIPLAHRQGELEGPFIGSEESMDPEKHVALVKINLQSQEEFFDDVSTTALPPGARKALIFVHGFNNSFQDAARRAAQIAYDVRFVGVPFFYSWPSNGSMRDYLQDGNQAEQAIVHLKEFMRDISVRGKFDAITLMAHSMGSRALTRAFLALKSELEPAHLSLFKEIILAAPDIDADVFRKDIAPQLIAMPSVTTLYASSRDTALKFSRKCNGAPRAGESGESLVVLKGMETIDATHADTNLFFGLRHSYFADSKDLLSDLHYLIEQQLRPNSRFGLEPVSTPPAPDYWRFRH